VCRYHAFERATPGEFTNTRRIQAGMKERIIVIVDDDRGLLRLIEKALNREGFVTVATSSGKEALAWLAKNHADLLLLDLQLQDIEGKELVRRLSEIQRRPPFVIITSEGDERVAVEMMKRGARDYLVKDVDFLRFVPGVVRHVLEQIETEHRLAAAEERVNLVESVVERGFSAVLIANADFPDPRILYINPSFAQFTGYSPEQVVGKPLSALDGLTALQQRLRQGLSGEEQFLEEISTYQTAEGERWGEWRVGPVKDRSGHITHWLVILRDMTERKRLEKELLEISDREQRRIGQDLHDGLCQQLAGIELMSQALEQRIAPRSKADAARAGEIAGHVREAIRQTRLLARGLSPATLAFEDVTSALEELASNTEKIFHVACRFECDRPVTAQDQIVTTHLFRIAQEAVSNAIKHGKATRITIRLAQPDGRLTLEVGDNGTGFREAVLKPQGMGLRIMQSRAGMIGGSLATENNPEGGARIICKLSPAASAKPKKNENGTKKEKP
jgi:PAS domain S-box-containing protein